MYTIDPVYCASSFLMYRTIADQTYSFSDKISPTFYKHSNSFDNIHNSVELEDSLRYHVEEICKRKKTAIALSGGIDSAILARFMPKGSIAYTFKCIVPGVDVIDETQTAAEYADACGLEHKIIEIYWEDFEKFAPKLFKRKGTPFHSIEVQIYKAALCALRDGNEAIVFGESSDLNYGGLSGLMSKDWTVGEFIDRYAYVKPYYALKDYKLIIDPILEFEKNGIIDVHAFNRNFFFTEAMGSYTNACNAAGIELATPYAETRLAIPLDFERIRRGENKYLVREVFSRLYPGFVAPPKTPMPRPMDQWFQNWKGPVRNEFWPNCVRGLSGDQKYYIWILEKYLNYIDDMKEKYREEMM